MSYANKPQLNVEKKDHVLWIKLNNTPTSNSITYEMINSLVSTLNYAEKDSQVRCVILTGEGKNFCSGGDLNRMLKKEEMFEGEGNELRHRYELGIQQISKCIENFSKPIIAMVNGAAAGAGCDIACMCDMRIGTSESRFLESFVKIGLVPGDGGTFFLQRIVGFAKAMEMTITGRAVLADEAMQIGLLNQIVKAEDLVSEVEKLAVQISNLPPVAVQLSKKAVKISYQNSLNVSLDLLAAYQGIAQNTRDHAEALTALIEKRPPSFNSK